MATSIDFTLLTDWQIQKPKKKGGRPHFGIDFLNKCIVLVIVRHRWTGTEGDNAPHSIAVPLEWQIMKMGVY